MVPASVRLRRSPTFFSTSTSHVMWRLVGCDMRIYLHPMESAT